LQVELGTVIGYDHLGLARAPVSSGRPDIDVLPGHLIDDGEDMKAVAASELVVDEITGD
jgi:hypothetical protein